MAETAAYELLMIFTKENNLLPVGMEPNWSVEKSIKCMKITVSQTSYSLSIDCCVKQWFRNIFCALLYSSVSFDPDNTTSWNTVLKVGCSSVWGRIQNLGCLKKGLCMAAFYLLLPVLSKRDLVPLGQTLFRLLAWTRRVWTSMSPLRVGHGEQPGSSVL